MRTTRSFPFIRRERPSLLVDILCGAAGGAIGTWLMSPTMQGVSKLMPQKEEEMMPQQGEQQEQREEEGATEKLARKVAEPLGIELQGEQKKKAGTLVHWGYGIAWGALYGALHRRVPRVGRLFGLGFGVGLFLFGDEFLVPALKLGPSPRKTPLRMHVSALAAHLAYGSAAEGSYRLLRRALT